eukprot:TRINITY_DN18476_c0_g1_i1.p1 TRINITY_DN18476_c0_g1~~TRINITY_DN18476_c0_g1_i1.p1  ORF type:complete len:500 (-),score=91.70 TRINITY_DN18476_c0_g1_i1:188-1657(-)
MYEPLVGQAGESDGSSCDVAITKTPKLKTALRRVAAAASLAIGCGLLGHTVMLRPGVGRQSADADLMLAAAPKSRSNSSMPASDDEASLIIMRHCARGMLAGSVKAPVDGAYKYTKLDDYSSESWKDFPEGEACLSRGADIIEAQGHFFKSHGNLPLPLRVTADTYPRNRMTTDRFLKGLQLQSDSQFFHDLFIQSEPGVSCVLEHPGKEAMVKNATEHMQANPPPAEYQGYLQKLYKLLGNGTAGDWTDQGCSIDSIFLGLPVGYTSYPVGACQIAAVATEYMLMQWGGGFDFAWGHMEGSELEKLLLVHSWWFYQWWGPVDVYKFFGASMARELAAKVSEQTTGTNLYMGHDANIMMIKGALGLRWEPEPFPANSTIPGCMLRFDRNGKVITASFWYPKTFSDTKGEMLSVPAIFASTASNKISASSFEHLLKHGSIEVCATLPPRPKAKAEVKKTETTSEEDQAGLASLVGALAFILFSVWMSTRK